MTEPNDSLGFKPWQAKISRRRFLGTSALVAGAAGIAGYLPDNLARVASASAATGPKSFDLSQIKHLVFLMQENRSFDHYFGTFPGVVGFSDPHAVRLPNGMTVFQQPDPSNPDGYLEPWYMNTATTGAAAVPSLSHNWGPQHEAWDNGAMDGWLRAHIAADSPARGPFTMGYYVQEDIPFHWALAQAFTLCDSYHCSVLGPTYPNRLFWSAGTNDPQGLGGGPVLETSAPPPLTFETAPETLFKAGITIKQYVADNAHWGFFANFKSPTILPAALYNSVAKFGTLWGNGTPGGLGDPANPTPASNPFTAFQEDCANGTLPDVVFLGVNSDGTGVENDEHPPALPAKGAQVIAQYLDALAGNEDLWNTTAFVLNYDENDGFFDHVVPPTPNQAEFPEEFVTKASAAGTPGGGRPVGAGFRVPAFVISPWSVGGNVFSGLSDHTSCLQLIEAVAAAGGLSGRGPVTFPNISRWRRQTFGDLTGAFVGAGQPAPASVQFDPTVRNNKLSAQTASSKLALPPFPGAAQTMPVQLKK